MEFGGVFIAFHSAIADIHEVFKLEAIFSEKIIILVLTSLGNVELILKIKIV